MRKIPMAIMFFFYLTNVSTPMCTYENIRYDSITKNVFYETGKDSTKAARLVSLHAPDYPKEAKNKKLEGKVYLKILVGIDGHAQKVEIIKSDNSLFNESAVDAAKKSLYYPAFKNDQRIEDWLVVPISFELKTERQKFYELGVSEMNKKNYKQAIEYFTKVFYANPRVTTWAYLEMSTEILRTKCYEKTFQYDLARSGYRRVILLEKDSEKKKSLNNELQEMLSYWYTEIKSQIEQAISSIASDPNITNNYLKLAQYYNLMEEWEQSEKWFEEYFNKEKNASPEEVLEFSAVASKSLKLQYGEAILKEYLERYPNDYRLQSRYGYFTMWLGKYDLAREAFERAFKICPNCNEVTQLGQTLNKFLNRKY